MNCIVCGKRSYSEYCMAHKPRKPIRRESFKSRNKRQVTQSLWFIKNPPDEDGLYTCYLQIHPLCPKRMLPEDVTQEHVKPKGRYPELKHDLNNIKAACEHCNKLKSGTSLEKLAETYTHLSKYLVDTT